ncbi:histidine kinase [Frankia sp. AiPs1]|uniref:histidine kinase n=1 Tax=Frankia sp. AiPs1 TaxID=573493 RepID=UPI002043A23A|nr:histidine kinase [Frankia sp. AiPs1]MCM3921023.1 histidine kinase [Frankia sp. AiPs1]
MTIALADGAQFALTSSAPRAEQAIAQVSRTGREALAEMRRLLGVLREDGAADGTAPQPGLTDLEALIDQVRQAGLPVRLTISGKPLDLPAGVQLTRLPTGPGGTHQHPQARRAPITRQVRSAPTGESSLDAVQRPCPDGIGALRCDPLRRGGQSSSATAVRS